MAERTVVKLDEHELLTYVRRCFEWRNADVFAIRGAVTFMIEFQGGIFAGSSTPFTD